MTLGLDRSIQACTFFSRTFSPYVSLDDITVLRPEHLSGQTLSSVMNQVSQMLLFSD